MAKRICLHSITKSHSLRRQTKTFFIIIIVLFGFINCISGQQQQQPQDQSTTPKLEKQQQQQQQKQDKTNQPESLPIPAAISAPYIGIHQSEIKIGESINLNVIT
ncbi:hypothetical protein BLOT_010028 [Blomia tropicalis]|nr:hypothetical protein BLOT_010028 [Blomia tropicalis]